MQGRSLLRCQRPESRCVPGTSSAGIFSANVLCRADEDASVKPLPPLRISKEQAQNHLARGVPMRDGRPLLNKTTSKPFVPRHSSIVCSVTGVVSICRGLCEPIGGVGTCGRLAPHAMIGRTQRAIQSYRLIQRGGSDS